MTSSLNDTISVIVPTYAGEQYLENCVDSLLTQTHKNLQIILVNDGSPDRSGEICDRYASLDRRVQAIHQRNLGLVSARKVGVAASTGEYIGFVDGDDWIAPEFYADLYESMMANRADFVISGHVREFMGKQEKITPRMSEGVYDRSDTLNEIIPQAIFNGKFFQHGVSTYVWNKLFIRETAVRLIQGIPDEILVGEDAALTYPYLMTCSRVAIRQDGGYFYRQRPRSILKSFPEIEAEYKRLSTLFRYLVRRFSDLPASSQVSQQLRNYFFASVLVRSGGIIHSPKQSHWFSAFPELTGNQRVVVCSSGSFGQHLVNRLEQMGDFEVVGWLDDDATESQVMGLSVSPLEEVANLDFDLLVIAAIDPDYSDNLEERLIGLGVDPQLISRLKPDFAALADRLQELGFDDKTFAFSPH